VLEFFKQNGFISSLVLLPYALLIRINNLFSAKSIIPSEDYSRLTNFILSSISNPILQGLLASLLVFIQAILINRLVIKHRITKETTHIPGLIFILLSAFLKEFLYLTPELLSLTFIIIATHITMATYNEKEAAGPVFTVGFLIGLSAIFYFPFYFYLFIGIISLIILKSLSLKDILQFVIGLGIPTFFHSVWEFFIESNSNIIPTYFFNNFNLAFVLLIQDLKALIVAIVIGIFMLFTLLSYGRYGQQKPTSTQIKIDILYWIAIFSLLSIMVTKNPGYAHILILIFPLSIFICMNFLAMKNKIVAEIIHLFMIIFAIIIQFGLIEI
jgi:hypothetical protein